MLVFHVRLFLPRIIPVLPESDQVSRRGDGNLAENVEAHQTLISFESDVEIGRIRERRPDCVSQTPFSSLYAALWNPCVCIIITTKGCKKYTDLLLARGDAFLIWIEFWP